MVADVGRTLSLSPRLLALELMLSPSRADVARNQHRTPPYIPGLGSPYPRDTSGPRTSRPQAPKPGEEGGRDRQGQSTTDGSWEASDRLLLLSLPPSLPQGHPSQSMSLTPKGIHI